MLLYDYLFYIVHLILFVETTKILTLIVIPASETLKEGFKFFALN